MNTFGFLLEKCAVNLGDEPPYLLARKRDNFFPTLFRDLGYKRGAEIGVEDGVFSRRLCQVVPDLKLYSIDPWLSYGYYTTTRYNQVRMDEKYHRAVETLAPFDCEILREFSHEAAARFENSSLDFVHIDGNHDFDNMRRDLSVWSPKIRPGGIVSGHDYFNSKNHARCRVKDAVDYWVQEHGIEVWFVIVGSRTPSWFWVNE